MTKHMRHGFLRVGLALACAILLVAALFSVACEPSSSNTASGSGGTYDAAGQISDGVSGSDIKADSITQGNADGTTGGSGTCSCATAGASLVVVEGCKDWPDATQCSGWHSVNCGDTPPESCAYKESDTFASGTEKGFAGCKIKLVCP